MAILRIRDENGQVHEIVALRGEKGADGNVSFDELTDAQKEELAGMIGDFTVDQELNENSTHAVANKVVTAELNLLRNEMSGTSYDFNERINASKGRLDDVEMTASSAINGASEAHIRLDSVEQQLGDVETALDSIIAIQNGLIGGASV